MDVFLDVSDISEYQSFGLMENKWNLYVWLCMTDSDVCVCVCECVCGECKLKRMRVEMRSYS